MAESARKHPGALACAPVCSAAEDARSDCATVSHGSLNGRQRSSHGGFKPLQMSRVMSACSMMSVGDHSGLREAQVARASIVRGGRLQGDDWLRTHVPSMKCMATISLTGPSESDLTGQRIDVAVKGRGWRLSWAGRRAIQPAYPVPANARPSKAPPPCTKWILRSMHSAADHVERLTMLRPTLPTGRHPQPARSAPRCPALGRHGARGRRCWPLRRPSCAAERFSWLLPVARGPADTPSFTAD